MDSGYAAAWGVDIGRTDKLTVGDTHTGSDLYHVAFPEDAEEAIDTCIGAVKGGIDLITMDSLASLLPRVHREAAMKANLKVGEKARTLRVGLDKLRIGIAEAARDHGMPPGVIWTNHFTMKIDMRNPKADPRDVSGGGGPKYAKHTAWRLTSAGVEHINRKAEDEGRMGVKKKEVRGQVEKSRGSMEKIQFTFSYYNSTVSTRFSDYVAGMTDYAKMLVDFLIHIKVVVKVGASSLRLKLEHYDETFTSAKALIKRMECDEVFMSSFYTLLMAKWPPIVAATLRDGDYYYPPWKKDDDDGKPAKAAKQLSAKPAPKKATKKASKRPPEPDGTGDDPDSDDFGIVDPDEVVAD
jgi:RecA/RadA recombinase